MKTLALVPLAAATVFVHPQAAHAFCGFYVGGAGAELFNNATQVVLMREGTRTVLSMQNNYQGPPENFAMVVPVPVVLQKDNVKTLPARSVRTRRQTSRTTPCRILGEGSVCPRLSSRKSHAARLWRHAQTNRCTNPSQKLWRESRGTIRGRRI